MYESCSTLLIVLRNTKNHPRLGNNIVTATCIIQSGSENTEQNLNFGVGLRLLIIIILIPNRFRQNASHLHVLLILELTHALLISVRPQIAIRRQLLIIIRGVCKCGILI